jgi:hypothetical protein
MEMPAAIPGASVPGVQVALVRDLKDVRLKGRLQPAPDRCHPVFRSACRHGMTCTKGFTLTEAQTPAAA